MRTLFRVLAVLVIAALALGIAGVVYNFGVNVGMSVAQGAAPGTVPPGWASYPYVHAPFGGIFGLLFGVLVVFLVFGLVRAAFGAGRWGGPGRPAMWSGTGGPGYWGDRESRIAEWHRELHRRDDEDAGRATGGESRPPGS